MTLFRLTGVSGGARLGALVDCRVAGTIKANDEPHGMFVLPGEVQRVEVVGGTRVVKFNVTRAGGTFDDVNLRCGPLFLSLK